MYGGNKRAKEDDGSMGGLSSNNHDGGDTTLRHDVNDVNITQSKKILRRNARNREEGDGEEREMER